MRTWVLPGSDGSVANRAIRGQLCGHGACTGPDRLRNSDRTPCGRDTSTEVFTNLDSLKFLERQVAYQRVDDVVRMYDHRLGTVAEDVVEDKGGDGDEQTARRRVKHLADFRGQGARIGNAARS